MRHFTGSTFSILSSSSSSTWIEWDNALSPFKPLLKSARSNPVRFKETQETLFLRITLKRALERSANLWVSAAYNMYTSRSPLPRFFLYIKTHLYLHGSRILCKGQGTTGFVFGATHWLNILFTESNVFSQNIAVTHNPIYRFIFKHYSVLQPWKVPNLRKLKMNSGK